jgi:HSP20 family protein
MNPLERWNHLRWNQLNELQDLKRSLPSLFNRSRVDSPEERAPRVPQWIPLVVVGEDARGYVIKAELPQVKKEDVKITLEDGMLTITGERKFDRNRKKDHPLGLANGCFAHSFAVPNDARPARVTVVFANEVLTVHLVRNQKVRPRQLAGKTCLASTIQRANGIWA